MTGLKINFANIDFSKVKEDFEDPAPDIKNLGDGLPEHEEINGNTHIEFESPILRLQGRQVVSIGSGMLLIAPQKTGKSQVCEAIAAAVVITDPAVKAKNEEEKTRHDMLGFEFFPPTNQEGEIDHRGVIYFDTERLKREIKQGFARIVKRTGAEKDEQGRVPKLKLVSLFGSMDTFKSRTIVEDYIKTGDYCMMILDGSADFVADENDLKESKGFVRWLITMAAKYRLGYAVTIHPNPGDHEGKGTGHLGTFLAKKLESIINMIKDEEGGDENARTLTTEKAQGGTRNDDSKINKVIYYSKEVFMFVSQEETNIQRDPVWVEALKHRKWMDEEDFLIMFHEKMKFKTAAASKRAIKDLVELRKLHFQNGKYMLPSDTETRKEIEINQLFPEGFDEAKGRGENYDVNNFPTADTGKGLEEEEPF